MIRYAEALNDIAAEAAKAMPSWNIKAKERTDLFARLGRYTEEYTEPTTGKAHKLPPFWSEIKPIYMRRQFNKCVYCEQWLEGGNYGPVAWDLEHFRPKGRVQAWPTRKHILPYDFMTGDESSEGYFLLAYHLHNYAAACKPCNSALKGDYFPIAGSRAKGGTHPSDYVSEKAFLPYPLGLFDEDPEDLITFEGAVAEPKWSEAQNTDRFRRGRVTIDFFDLNRDELTYLRASYLLNTVWSLFQLAENGSEQAKRRMQSVQSPRAPFTNCARCFLRLCHTDRNKAAAMTLNFEIVVEALRN